jgi:hypothetical protein
MMSNHNEASDHSNRFDERTRFGESLLVCGECGSKLMYPASCTEHGESHWYIELQCPDCHGLRGRLFEATMLDALDRELDRAEAALEADLAHLTQANMADYATRFVTALNAGAIQPADFTE